MENFLLTLFFLISFQNISSFLKDLSLFPCLNTELLRHLRFSGWHTPSIPKFSIGNPVLFDIPKCIYWESILFSISGFPLPREWQGKSGDDRKTANDRKTVRMTFTLSSLKCVLPHLYWRIIYWDPSLLTLLRMTVCVWRSFVNRKNAPSS